MAKYTTLTALFADIANAVRRKTGGTASIAAEEFPTAIDALDTGGIHPSGTKSITTNGTHDVTNYASASVNIPASGITPTGTKTITANGSHDVTSFATAQVNVPVGITPSGTKDITTNGTHDVTNYASAKVNIPVGITPSGSKTITENGTHDVTSYASAVVNVPVPAQNMVTLPATISSSLGNGTNSTHTVLTGNDFVKQNYAKDGFFAMLFPVNAGIESPAKNLVNTVYTGNRLLMKTNLSFYGIYVVSNGASSAIDPRPQQYKISASGYNVCFRATSAGNLNLYVGSTFTVPAGNYLLILGLAE